MLGEGQKLLDDAKISDADEFKTTTNIGIQKTTEATGGWIGNKIADKIARNSLQHHSDTDSQI